MSSISESLVGSIKIRSSLDDGLAGTLFTESKELGRSLEIVPVMISVSRKHPTGCNSVDMVSSLSGKPCIDCSSYPYRDSTSPCKVEYTLTGIANDCTHTPYSICFSEHNWVTGEALYRLLTSYWSNPWDVMLSIASSKSGSLTVKRSPNTPSEAQKQTANAIANSQEGTQHG